MGCRTCHTGESWPTCGECESALSFFFQLRQGDYPTILQHAFTMSPQPQLAPQPSTNDTHHSDRGSQQTGSRKRAVDALDEDGTEQRQRDTNEQAEGKDAHSEAIDAAPLSAADRARLAARRDGMLFQFLPVYQLHPAVPTLSPAIRERVREGG